MKNVVHSLDAWLWRRGIHHPQVRVILRAQILFSGLSMVLGAALAPFSLWPLWFAVGSCLFLNVFWGIARHMLRVTLTAYSSALFISVLLRAGARLFLTAVVLYVSLIVCNAPAVALVCGLSANTALALGTFALVSFAGRSQS